MKKSIVLLADGCEEIEVLTPVDYLRRAGAEVTTAAVKTLRVNGSHRIPFEADMLLKDVDFSAYDVVIVPGGMPGAVNLAASADAGKLIRSVFERGGIIAAICAAPAVVLSPLGILQNRTYTCYPDMEKNIPKYAGSEWQQLTRDSVHTTDRVVVDGNLITSRGPGCAEEFALTLIQMLCGDEKAASIHNAICAR